MSFPLKRTAAAVATALLGVALSATAGQAHTTASAPQQPAARAAAQDATARVDRLWAIEGDEQTVKAGQQVPVRLKVRAFDANRKPVKGAVITFSTPGPGLKFPDGGDDATATTDQNGYATAPALKASGSPGPDLVTAGAGTKARVAFEITIT
ncbi:Ig-like domain-containing protein [Kitasatospora sp. NBC_00070]|uniref:hypothetical protein n=1 Tax=Kitasatospora sp. NBC_00070 TaxID=2975962 RepID=UPI003253A96E